MSNRSKLILNLAVNPTRRNAVEGAKPNPDLEAQAVPKEAQSNPDPKAQALQNRSQLGYRSKVNKWLKGLPCRKKLQFTSPKKRSLERSNVQDGKKNVSDGIPTTEESGHDVTEGRTSSTAGAAQKLSNSALQSSTDVHDQTNPCDGIPTREENGLHVRGDKREILPPIEAAQNLSQREGPFEPRNVLHDQSNLSDGITTKEQDGHNVNGKEGQSPPPPAEANQILQKKPSNVPDNQTNVFVGNTTTDQVAHNTAQGEPEGETHQATRSLSPWFEDEDIFSPTVTVLGIQTADNVFSYTVPTPLAAMPPSDVEVSSPFANLEFDSFDFNEDLTENVTHQPIPENTRTTTPGSTNPVGEDNSNDRNDLTLAVTPSSSDMQSRVVESHDDLNNNEHQTGLANPSELISPTRPSKRTRTATPGSGSPVRKRSMNQAMWKCSVRKLAVNTGQEYVSSRKKLVKAREMRPPCSCKFDCVHRVSEEQRKRQFDTFWALASHDRQWEFIRNFSKTQPTKLRTPDQGPQKRNCSRTFFFEIDGKQVNVCKNMFMATLSIWDGWIDSAYSHVNHAKGKVATPDKRGRHSNHPKQITPQKIDSVKEHVAEFPRVPSHYCRARTKREFLQKGLSLKKMAKLYENWAEVRAIPPASRATMRQYVDIVNSHFNLGFFKPKKDQCKLCVFMTSKDNSPQLKAQYKNEYATHIKNKQLIKKIKQQDKAAAEKDRTIAFCFFDLQKQLCVPHSQASPFYYKSKLNVYNFTVFHSIKRKGFCYLWHEGMAKKGSDEVSSSILNFIGKLVEEGCKEFIFYSDNCAGQNKNRFIFSMYELAAVRYSVKITHKYLEPGHTMMEVDSIHARIELSTQDSEIFDFNGWIEAIENAKEELPKYEVISFKKGFVCTFKPLVNMQNWEYDLKGKKITWSKVKEISINGTEGNLVRIKYSYDGEIITLSPNKPGRPVNLKTYNPPQAYNAGIPLSANTIRDLNQLLKSNAIPEMKRPFYQQVLTECSEIIDDAASEAEYDPVEDLCVGDTLEDEVQEEHVD